MINVDPYLSYSFRPFRIGFCCERPTDVEVLEMAGISFTLWGGRYNPIVDVADETAPTLVREYGCDILYAYHNTPAVNALIEAFPELKYQGFEQKLFLEGDGHHYPLFFDLCSCRMNFADSPEPVQWIRVNNEHPASRLLQLHFGYLPPPSDRLPLDYVDLLNRMHLPGVVLTGDELPSEPFFEIAEYGARRIVHQPLRRQVGIVVGDSVDGSTLRHLWNMTAAGFGALIYDSSNDALLPWVAMHATNVAASFTENPHEQYYIWTRDHLNFDMPTQLHTALAPVADKVVIAPIGAHRAPLNDYLSRIRGAKRRGAMPSVSQRDKPVVQFMHEGLIKRWRPFNAENLLLEVRSSAHPEQPRSITFRPPYAPRANRGLARAMEVLPRDRLRTQLDGFALIVRPDSEFTRISGAFGDEVVREVFASARIGVELSDKGRYTDQVIRHLGGLQKARIFKVPGVRRLIDRTADGATVTVSQAKLEIRGAEADRELERFNFPLYTGQRPPLTNGAVWDYLMRKRVFIPGSDLKCEVCSLSFWMAIDDLKTSIVCPYCSAELVAGPLLKSNLDWKYRRSPLFSVDASLHGAASVILTLQQLHTRFGEDVVAWSASVNLTVVGAPPCESDFVAVVARSGARTALFVGECKTAGDFNENDIRNLERVIEALGDEIDSYIVFSKLARFSDPELALLRAQSAELRRKVILFDRDALEAYEAYTARPVVTVEELARASAVEHAYGALP